MPGLELVHDYVSAAAYNSGALLTSISFFSFIEFLSAGVRTLVSAHQLLNRDDESQQERFTMIKSSSRGRVNAWLPLYINSENWAQVKALAPSAFSLIATQSNDLFKPIHALHVRTI